MKIVLIIIGIAIIIFSSSLLILETIKLDIDLRESLIPFICAFAFASCLFAFGKWPAKRAFANSFILLIIAALISIIAYSGIEFFSLTSKGYIPEFYIWGDGYNTPEFLDVYKKFNIKRVVHFTESECNEDSGSYKLIKLYRKEGIDFIVCIWFGDYVSASNSKKLLETWSAFKGFYLKNKPEFGENFYVLIDSESRAGFWAKKESLVKRGKRIDWYRYLLAQYNRAIQRTGVRDVQVFVDDVKSLGLKPMLIAMPLVVDDQITPQNNIQTLFDLASVPPYNWDSFGYMIYRQDEDPAEGYRLGNHFVYSYARSIKKLHQDKSNLLLGVAGRGPYQEIDEIIKDIHIAKSLGINMLGLYRLKLLLEIDGISGLEKIFSSIKDIRKVSFSLKKGTTLMRQRNFLSDIFLTLLLRDKCIRNAGKGEAL